MCTDTAMKKVVPKYFPTWCSDQYNCLFFMTLHEFNTTETVTVSHWQDLQTPAVLRVFHANSFPLLILNGDFFSLFSKI